VPLTDASLHPLTQERDRTAIQHQCFDWVEVVGDGKTDPCKTYPSALNLHLNCGSPLPKGVNVMACKGAVEVPLATPTCTRHQTFIADGKTNYCMIKVRHAA
jgi:hypothetical protein